MANGNGRQAHCKRIFRTNDDGTIDPDIYIDVMRLDKLPVNFQSEDTGIQGQVVNLFAYWNDDPGHPMQGVDGSTADAQGENANADRETEKIEIRNPDNPPDDSSESNHLWIVDRMAMVKSGDGSGAAGQVVNLIFNNEPGSRVAIENGEVGVRTFHVAKVVNNDLGGLKMADDDGSNPILVDASDYLQAMRIGIKDDSQHLDVEIADDVIFVFQSNDDGVAGQVIIIILDNDPIEQILDSGNPNAVPQPVRTDPLQAIVNVQFKVFGAIALWASKNGNQVTFYKKTRKVGIGTFQSLGFLDFTENGTVRGCSYAKVITDIKKPGDPVFLLCGDDGADVTGGDTSGIIMISNDGEHWTTTATEPGVRFLDMTWNPDDKAFFVQTQSWVEGDRTTLTCWTSTDGKSWSVGGGDFESHLKYGVPDGQYGFDPSKGKKGHLVLASDLNVGALTFAGGVWIRNNEDSPADLDESVDDTKTWQQILSGGDQAIDAVFPLIAGAWRDVKAWQARQQ